MFYDRYVALCQGKNLTPSKAAEEIGLNKASVTNWKKNGYTPRADVLQRIAAYFGVSIGELLTNESTGAIEFTVPTEEMRDYLQSKKKAPTPVSESGPKRNIVKIAGRDGSYVERNLTDEQLAAIKMMIEQLPDAEDL